MAWGKVTSCQRCWSHEPGWFDWLRLDLETEQHSGADDGSEYELIFMQEVLKKVEGLDPTHVHVQYEVDRPYKPPLRPDFAIMLPGKRPIAIEIDGARKSADPPLDERDRSLVRDGELKDLGWEVQHFTNNQVIHKNGWCRQTVTRLLAEVSATAVAAPTSQPAKARSGSRRNWWLAALIGVVVLIVASGLAFAVSRSGDQPSSQPDGGTCDAQHPVKGNVSQTGNKIYHAPGWQYYDRTVPEECFVDRDAAEDAGYRASEVQ
ncbi:hypothetical protein EKO23_16285 [Nocardioides guangzhouensis]|uniref:DUF559 domain-containing protein n=1 Tax=Nocardioides guangzhouensis TaxID=2497878 RepID=A0A4Q4Z9G9_9ACTN|nr:hypothetical protein [Nocardioides guangzhouensis]RYP84218.1 hypothetical protein EKO23_16285 [Nocardioides guangzhouensis]